MRKRKNVKGALMISCVMLSVMLSAGCAGNGSESSVSEAAGENSPSASSAESTASSGEQSQKEAVIEKKSAGEPSAPDGSMSFEDACKLLDKCGMEELYLPQSAKDYEKLYFATIDYEGEKFYSIYTYINADGKKIFVGTNYIVSIDGEFVGKKHWFGDFSVVGSTSAIDKQLSELYPDTKITPNEALALLAKNEKSLKFDRPIEDYIFEVNPELRDVNGVTCYRVTPKLEYIGHIVLEQNIYIASDGSGGIYRLKNDSFDEYEILN